MLLLSDIIGYSLCIGSRHLGLLLVGGLREFGFEREMLCIGGFAG